jgi:hypothetical protein
MNSILSKFQSFIANIIVFLLFGIFSFGPIGLGIYYLISEYSETNNAKKSMNWPTTAGIIISSDFREKEDTDSVKKLYSPKILYSYSVKIMEYSSQKIFFGNYSLSLENARKIVNRYPAGKRVTVFYNPDKHDLSVLEPGGKTFNYYWLLLGVGLLSFGIFVLLQALIFDPRKESKIADTFRQASLRLGMKYIEKDEHLKNEGFDHFPLFQKGYETGCPPPEIRNVIRGQKDGIKKMLFRYIFFTDEGETNEKHDELFAVIATPESNLSRFEMYPKKLGDKIGAIFGKKHDIKFQSYREFSNNYLLHGFREQAVRKLFDSEILNFFSEERGWSIEGGGDWLVIYKATPIDLDAVLNMEKTTTLISLLLSK